MELSERQKQYLQFYETERKRDIDVNDREQMITMVVFAFFQMYLTAKTENDKMEVAWNINRIRPEIKEKIKLWHLIEDKEEFNSLITKKIEQQQKQTLNHQGRRHERRDDFALSVQEWNEVILHFDNECAYCGKKVNLTFDHFHPFSKGGDFGKGNIIPACRRCNSSKHNKLFQDWYPKQKFYSSDRMKKVLDYIESNKQLALF